ncbi:hypothetical protein Bca52824_094351 [Brassica carinata]|uniref:CCHC-type domain-containing protein n=1 Tax=Brassica carinata TaxID=52824 RepID=A0A8X7TJW6_BRACI|nr:hypothetical protein Bca52824_094351 [Brassica carinata]
MGTPIDHISGAPFVLIPDENIEAAKMEFKDFIYARFHGDYPSMGKIIGVVNAVWARTGPRIFVHNLGQGTYLLRVTNPRTREVFLSRTCWNIGGLPMFVAPWSPEYSPDEPPLTSAIVPIEMRNVPFLLFNRESLSRIATAIGKPESLAPETERKENFEVAKLYVRVDLTSPLPHKVVSGFSNGNEVMIDVSYPWLPIKCDSCSKFGHIKERCPTVAKEASLNQARDRMLAHQTSGRRSKSRSGRSYDKKSKNLETCYVPIVRDTNCGTEPQENDTASPKAQESGALEEGEIYQETEDHETDADNADVVVSDQQSVKDRRGDLQDVISDRVAVEVISSESLSEAVPAGVVELITEALVSNVDPGGSANLDSDQDVAKQEGTERQDTASTLKDQDRDNPFFLVKNRKTIPRGWKFFGNFEEDVSGRIIIVWDPIVMMCIYHATAQSVTCGATILSENITLTVTFVYGFNQVEERRALWDSLVELQDTSPVASHPWSVIAGMDDANLGLQDAQLFEAQTKGPPYTWRNMQDDNPISTKIDHAFINQAWSSAFPDSYAEFLDPSQSDHAPCLLRMPSIRRRVVKPFKFFHHVIDHPEYAETVTDNWKCDDIVGTDQFKLVCLLKKLKRPLRSLNKRHFSGISQRVKGQKEKVDALQRALLTSPDNATAAEEHVERDKLNTLLKAEEKFYRQRSRVRWADVGDRNIPFYHRTVSQHASRNHIHYLKDTDDRMLFSMDDIKAHAANYFRDSRFNGAFALAPPQDLTSLLPMSTAGIKETMNLFKNWSGLDINEKKSEIFYGGYSDIQKSVLSDLSGFQRGEFPTRYLGLPLSPKRISAATLQPLVDRITSKLHSWTVKFLSFAGKVKMIYSVIYGMVNFWSSVFVLPKWFYAKVDSLCSGFLWKNNTTSAIGARVSWVNICKPKSEGGLGIRQLEEFEMVFRLTRVWLFFSESGSLWVPWLRNNRFGGRSFWQINDAQRFSSTVRSMIQLKPDLQGFLRCSIELGLLLLLFGSSGSRTLRIPLNATVSQAVSNGHWNLPPARSDIAETLHVILSTTRSGGFAASFSSRVTWERLRTPNPSVQWHSFVWFKEEIPRCSFISWTAFLGRLPTRDRLISWGFFVPPGCCHNLQGPQARRVAVVLKLLCQVIIYNLWCERNARIFRDVRMNQDGFFRVVDRSMRDRLLSPSLISSSSPSLLELYFWFISPYS